MLWMGIRELSLPGFFRRLRVAGTIGRRSAAIGTADGRRNTTAQVADERPSAGHCHKVDGLSPPLAK